MADDDERAKVSPLSVDDLKCWYVPGSVSVVDFVNPATGLTLYGNKDEAAIRAEYPDAQLIAGTDAIEHTQQANALTFKRPVSEISEETYFDRLEVLPPQDWSTVLGVESFKMMERTSGSITGIYARAGDRYFTMADDFTTSPQVIAQHVNQFMHQQRQQQAIEILQRTHDGDDLTTRQLLLVQHAVNGHLDRTGKTEFPQLYAEHNATRSPDMPEQASAPAPERSRFSELVAKGGEMTDRKQGASAKDNAEATETMVRTGSDGMGKRKADRAITE